MPDFNAETTADEAAAHFAAQIRGRTVLVTGASPKSLGAECARVVAKNGAKLVILAGRTRKNLDATADAIRKETPGANVRILEMDLGDLESVRRAAKEVNSLPENINVLFNNAAVMATPYRPVAGTPLEEQFYMNHIGHFLFTNLILTKVLAASKPGSPSRIINVSSLGHGRSPIRFDDPGFGGGRNYDPWAAYGQSKTANILFSRELARRHGPALLSYSLHPGGIVTNLGRDLTKETIEAMQAMRKGGNQPPRSPRKFKKISNGTSTWVISLLFLPTCRSPWCLISASHIVAGFDPAIADRNGAYLQDCKVDEEACAEYAKDLANAARLWEMSEQVVGQKFGAGAKL
ncbi:hypothetical protein DFJ74DRAFT_376766 [Hyaloraphidium curvatum]|nr:hypothetical protein DFJ74DRAFT_376766 [Hyaloraphidium curvatum]